MSVIMMIYGFSMSYIPVSKSVTDLEVCLKIVIQGRWRIFLNKRGYSFIFETINSDYN